jgi:hypothetical protein
LAGEGGLPLELYVGDQGAADSKKKCFLASDLGPEKGIISLLKIRGNMPFMILLRKI